jgi:ferrous iron transport protein B
MVLELPEYRWPSLRNAALVTWDRANVFVRNAGTMILAISVVMWWLSAFPRADGDERVQQAQSFAGRLGELLQPVFAPLGFDAQLTVGVMTSFLAREVFVSTMAVLAGAGADADAADATVLEQVGSMARADGAPVFDLPTTAAALVFFVLAMQCLPTLAVTRRETGSWKWPAIQFGWMTLVAYAAALAAHAIAAAWTGAS